MKTNKFASIVLLTTLLTGACVQKPIEPVSPTPTTPTTPTKGSADFSKFVALGDSYVAGTQGGTVFNASQANSLPKILADQFATVGGGAFNQPNVNHENGLNFVVFGGSGGLLSVGRYVLFDPDGDLDPDGAGCATSRSAAPRAAGVLASPAVCPSTSPTPAMPAPYNTFQTVTELVTYTADRSILNNFGVPGTRVFHTPVAAYGAPPPTGSPWYFRQATNPGTSTLLGDAASKGHKFFLLSLGLFDMIGYASSGAVGDPNDVGPAIGAGDMTSTAVFNPSYDANLAAMLADPTTNGVVTTIPDITTLPFFFTVAYNSIELKSSNCNDANLITGLNQVFASYNATLDAILAGQVGPVPPGLTAEDVARRKVVFGYGKNPVLIQDETLIDLTASLTAVPGGAIFAQWGKMRPATATDMITLSAGSILGTCADTAVPPVARPAGWPAPLPWLFGLGAPLSDGNVLIPTEITEIQARTVAFNDKIKAAADTYAGRVAVADLYKAYKDLVAAKAYVSDGVTITPSFAPPAGMFSEDGIHPNSRGYAFTANVIIDAINSKFGATLPKAKLSSFSGTGLPVKGQ